MEQGEWKMNNEFYPIFRPNPENQTPPNKTGNNSFEIRRIKLSLFGNIIQIIGAIISTYAQIMALEDLQSHQPSNDPYDERIKKLESQIQYLTKAIEKQKDKKSY